MNVPRFTHTTTTAFRPQDTTTALRPAHMDCPECKRAGKSERLQPLTAARTEFCRCGGCGGAWFNEKDLDVALQATGAAQWPAPAGSHAATAESQATWGCPCCGGLLIEVKDRQGLGVSVRRCLVCYGGWIPYPALQRSAEAHRGMLEKIGKFVSGLIPSQR